MTFMDHRRAGNASAHTREALSYPITDPGNTYFDQVEQLAFPSAAESVPTAGPVSVADQGQGTAPAEKKTQLLPQKATRLLTDTLLPSKSAEPSPTTAMRDPLLIAGTYQKKERGRKRASNRRRLAVQLSVTTVLFFIIVGTIITVVPLDAGGQSGFRLFSPLINTVHTKSDDTALIMQQAATATAVTTDGVDVGVNVGQYAGVQGPPPGADVSGNHFFWGNCTYWADMRYHQLTGVWVPWFGNASAWASGAYSYGWHVSSTPKVYSIIVLQPGVQGAGWAGHVAIVEGINANGSVNTTNYNWGAGNFGVETWATFYPGPGVSFIWAQGH